MGATSLLDGGRNIIQEDELIYLDSKGVKHFQKHLPQRLNLNGKWNLDLGNDWIGAELELVEAVGGSSNIDGGAPDSVYLPSQNRDGGAP